MSRLRLGAAASRDKDLITRAEGLSLDRPYAPTAYIRSNIDRMTGPAPAGVAALSTGRLTLTALYLQAGEVVTSLTFISGTTAGATLTHTWFALYDFTTRALIRQTNDDTSAAWATATVKTLNLSSTYTVPTTGLYFAGINVTGTTVPTIIGNTTSTALLGLTPLINGSSTTGLTATAPATAAAPSAIAGQPLVLAA